jgi:hypothetical protein
MRRLSTGSSAFRVCSICSAPRRRGNPTRPEPGSGPRQRSRSARAPRGRGSSRSARTPRRRPRSACKPALSRLRMAGPLPNTESTLISSAMRRYQAADAVPGDGHISQRPVVLIQREYAVVCFAQCIAMNRLRCACGSRSTISVGAEFRASAAARLSAVVVLPTPPFWLKTAILTAGYPPFPHSVQGQCFHLV